MNDQAKKPGGGQAFGRFEGEARTLWLTDPAKPDRHMCLEETLTFHDARTGKAWAAPKGKPIDGASIPRALWTLVGSPYTGDYRRASIVHDIACYNHPEDGPERRAADRMFYAACRAGGCSAAQAYLLYIGVRIGSTWAGRLKSAGEPEGPKLRTSPEDDLIQAEYRALAEAMTADGVPPSADDPEEAERRYDMASDKLLAR